MNFRLIIAYLSFKCQPESLIGGGTIDTDFLIKKALPPKKKKFFWSKSGYGDSIFSVPSFEVMHMKKNTCTDFSVAETLVYCFPNKQKEKLWGITVLIYCRPLLQFKDSLPSFIWSIWIMEKLDLCRLPFSTYLQTFGRHQFLNQQ